MSVSPILIPLSRLSTDPHHRHAQLRDYFCDKDATVDRVDDRWALSLDWSNDPWRYVDPRLDEGLAWWGANIQYRDMAMARKRRGRFLLSSCRLGIWEYLRCEQGGEESRTARNIQLVA